MQTKTCILCHLLYFISTSAIAAAISSSLSAVSAVTSPSLADSPGRVRGTVSSNAGRERTRAACFFPQRSPVWGLRSGLTHSPGPLFPPTLPSHSAPAVPQRGRQRSPGPEPPAGHTHAASTGPRLWSFGFHSPHPHRNKNTHTHCLPTCSRLPTLIFRAPL